MSSSTAQNQTTVTMKGKGRTGAGRGAKKSRPQAARPPHRPAQQNVTNQSEAGAVATGKSTGNGKEVGETAVSQNESGAISKDTLLEIHGRMDRFAESSKALLKVLEEIEAIHPFIGAAVLAFKAVVALELTRRENDDKIMVLQLKMQEMMEVFAQLRGVTVNQASDVTGYAGVKDRLQGLCNDIAKDIVACGTLCSSISKKNFLARLLKGPIYEERLAGYVEIVEGRQKELELALLVFTVHGVQTANATLSEVQKTIQATQQSVDTILLFQRLQTPKEKLLNQIIKDAGGPKKAAGNPEVLRKLVELSNSLDQTPGGEHKGWRAGKRPPRPKPSQATTTQGSSQRYSKSVSAEKSKAPSTPTKPKLIPSSDPPVLAPSVDGPSNVTSESISSAKPKPKPKPKAPSVPAKPESKSSGDQVIQIAEVEIPKLAPSPERERKGSSLTMQYAKSSLVPVARVTSAQDNLDDTALSTTSSSRKRVASVVEPEDSKPQEAPKVKAPKKGAAGAQTARKDGARKGASVPSSPKATTSTKPIASSVPSDPAKTGWASSGDQTIQTTDVEASTLAPPPERVRKGSSTPSVKRAKSSQTPVAGTSTQDTASPESTEKGKGKQAAVSGKDEDMAVSGVSPAGQKETSGVDPEDAKTQEITKVATPKKDGGQKQGWQKSRKPKGNGGRTGALAKRAVSVVDTPSALPV